MSEWQGVDVSKYQGNINWAKVAAAGKSFAILKVTQKNNSVESSFNGNYVGAISAGLDVGVYRYVYAKTVKEAQAEAEAIVKAIGDKQINSGVWLDLEDSSIKGIGKAQLTSIINAEAYVLKKAGLGVGVYCNRDWYLNVLDSAYLKTMYPFWIARYPASDAGSYLKDSKLAPKDYAVAWQYSSKGKVNGISGNVDLDVSYSKLKDLFVGFSNYYPACSSKQVSIIAALKEVGETNTSLDHRKQIGIQNGIAGVGTINGNCQMLNMLKAGKLKKA